MITLSATGQNILFLQEKANLSNGTLKIPVLVESDTVIGVCPTVTVKVFDTQGNLLDKQTTNTNPGFAASLDFVDCSGSVELSVPPTKNAYVFQALSDGEVITEGNPVAISTLKDPPEERGSVGTLKAVTSSVVALVSAYALVVFLDLFE